MASETPEEEAEMLGIELDKMDEFKEQKDTKVLIKFFK